VPHGSPWAIFFLQRGSNVRRAVPGFLAGANAKGDLYFFNKTSSSALTLVKARLSERP